MTMDSVGRLFAPALPEPIKRARARAVEHPQLFLKGKATALVQVLITYTDLEALSKPLRFNRETPATLLSVSTRTIDRLLAQLEELGWLKRLPQPRLDDGVWGCTSIKWADWVISDIFAVAKGVNKWRSSRPHKGDAAPGNPDAAFGSSGRATETAHLSSSPKGEVFQNKVVTDDSGKKAFDPFGERKKSQRRLPADLEQPMHELGLTPANVCWLMAKCKAKGVRLQQVLAATAQTLRDKGLKAKNALAWLVYMISLDRDYAYEARRQGQQMAATRKTTRRRAFLQRLSDAAFKAGTVLPNGARVVAHMDGIVTLQHPDGGKLSASPSAGLAATLARAQPSWARMTLRGPMNASPAAAPPTRPSQVPPSAMDAVDRTVSRASIAAIKELLGRRAPLQRSAV